MNVLKKIIPATLVAGALFCGVVGAQPVGMQHPVFNPKEMVTHTQERLKELKAKLNLEANQQAAWDSWSAQVLEDIKKQASDDERFRKGFQSFPKKEMTTPERLDFQIKHTENQLEFLQGKLTSLQHAKANTLNFYNALNQNQKTIFDLFWVKPHAWHHQFRDGSQRK